MQKSFIVIVLFLFATITYSQERSYLNVYDELLELNTDRKEYIAGEIVWFKVLARNLNDFDAERSSKIAYIEVLNSYGFPVIRKKIPLMNKRGSGELVLQDTLSSGLYKVIAYTNWTKNDEVCFIETSILVYNPQKPLLEKNQKTQKSKIEISLGGNDLVDGLENTVYFRVQNNDFDRCKVSIKEKNDSLVKELQLVKPFGKIEFTPEINKRYLLSFENKDTTINVVLPDVKNDGLVINLESNSGISADFRVQGSNLFRSLLKKVSYNINNSLINKTFDLDSSSLLSILSDSLRKGKNNIVFRNRDGRIIWQREFYGNDYYCPLKIEGIMSGGFEKRRIIPLFISKENSLGLTDSLNISVSIRKIPDPDLLNYEKLASRVFDEENVSEIDRLNNKLIFKSNHNYRDNIKSVKYTPEFKGALLSGKIINIDGLPLANNDIFLSYPDSVVNVKITKTNEVGEFSFFIKPDKPVRDILINANNHSKDLTILIDNNFLDDYPVNEDYKVDLNDEYRNYLTELYLNYKISQLYDLPKSKVDSIAPIGRSNSIYDKGVRIINFDNYMKLDSIREYFYEIIPEVKIVKQGANSQFRIRDIKTNKPSNSEPAIFVDGIYVSDANLVLSLSPNNCKRIEIIQRPVLLKNRIYEGLIAIFTKKYDFPIALPSNALRMEYNIFDQSSIFKKAIPENSITPSFFNTLYWNPNVFINSASTKIEFFTGDDNSWYEILCRGITPSGKYIYTRIPFRVSNKNL